MTVSGPAERDLLEPLAPAKPSGRNAMNGDTDDQYELEEEWLLVARSENYNCPICHQTIIYSEREVFFQTGLCGQCTRQQQREDGTE